MRATIIAKGFEYDREAKWYFALLGYSFYSQGKFNASPASIPVGSLSYPVKTRLLLTWASRTEGGALITTIAKMMV
ncbi:hypothetical protein OH492_20905 [Vibrio chagasii]|nr:hypothetical protein [Vibrio chagasii]